MSRLKKSQVPFALDVAMRSNMGIAGKLDVVLETESDMPTQGIRLVYASLTGTGVLIGPAGRH
jgi:hypothetical protein